MDYAIQLEKNKTQWIEAVKSGDSKALELVYRAYRKPFVNWLTQQTSCNQDMALDVFQESVLALYKNAKSGRLDDLKSGIKTYLFAIGKRVWLYRNRQHKVKTSAMEIEDLPVKELIVNPSNLDSMSERQQLVSQLLSKMRPSCRSILFSFYYENLRLKEVAEKLNYKSVNVVKAMKGRCMEALKKMVYQHIKTA